MTEIDLIKICKDIIDECPHEVNNYKSGQINLLGMFVGEAMKKSRGHADPRELSKIMKDLLNKK